MKNKIWSTLFRGALIGVVLLFCYFGGVWLVDEVFNGAFKEWFYSRFLTDGVFLSNWGGLKQFFVYLFLLLMTLLVVACAITAIVASKRRNARQITLISDYISAMTEEPSLLPSLPSEYAEIEAKLTRLNTDSLRSRQLMEAEMQRKNDLITYLAHDLKTPLASVIGYLNLLDEAPDLPAEQRAKYIGITLEKANRLEQLINEFFEIVRFNLHSIVLNYEKVDLSLLLRQLADEFYPMLAPGQRTAQLQVPEKLIIRGDSDKLARVFNNILKNAIAYSYEGTAILIQAEEDGGLVTVTFTDRGDPIPEHKLGSIFEKFYRLDSARSSQTGGAGLGLAIAQEIVTAHRGEITAESDAERTVFTVHLPVR